MCGYRCARRTERPIASRTLRPETSINTGEEEIKKNLAKMIRKTIGLIAVYREACVVKFN